jgi:hypothetical protein
MNYKSNFNVRPSGISSGFVEFERNVVYPELVEDGDFSQLGAELTTPFTSGWNQIGSNGWSLNPAPVNGGLEGIEATNYVYQGLTTAIGKQYQVVVDATVIDGSCVVRGFNSNDIIDINVKGRKTYSAIFTETDTNTNFGFAAFLEGGFTGIIHSVSVKELGVGWTLGVGWSIPSRVGIALRDGTGLGNTWIGQTINIEAGKTYSVSYDRKYTSGGPTTNLYAAFINEGVNTTLGGYSSTIQETITVTDTFTPTYTGSFLFRLYGVSTFTGEISNVTIKEVGEATESALPNQSECEAYGYTWNSGNRTCQAFNPSITLERITGNLSNNLYGSNNKTQRGTQNSMTIGDFNSLNGSTENNLIVGRGNSIERKTANNFIVGTAAKSIVDNSFSLGGNNGVANQLDRLGAQLIENFDFSQEIEILKNADFSIYEPSAQSNLIGGVQFDDWIENPSTGKRKMTAELNGFKSEVIVKQTSTWHQRFYQSVSSDLVIGKKYRFTATFLTSDGSSIRVAVQTAGSTSIQAGATYSTDAGVYQSIDIYFTCTSRTSQIVDLWPTTLQEIGEYFSVSNLSVKEVGEDWTLSANASIQNNELTLNGSGAFVYAQQTLWSSGAKNGRTLRFIYEVTENTLVSGERGTGLLRVGGYSNSLFPSVINLNSDVGTHILDVIVGIEGAHNVFDIDITSDYVSGYIKINYVSLQEVLPFVAPRQMTYLMFGKQTTDGNTKAANLNNTSGTFYVVPLNSASYFQCDVVAVRTGGTSTTGAIGDTASWTEKGVFTNVNQEGGLSISRERDTVRSIGTGTTNWRPTAVVGNTNGNFNLNVRGTTDMIIEWAITVRITQIKTTF